VAPTTEGDTDDDPDFPPIEDEEPDDAINTDIRDLLLGFLQENQLPESLMGFITQSLAEKKSYAQIVAELRETPEYKAAYPENEVRLQGGYEWLPESQIREMRSEIRRLAAEYMGVGNVSQEELTEWIGSGKSVRVFETKLQRMQDFERYGPTVKAVLEMELGRELDDERLFAFFDDTPTPDLDRAYEKALMRGQPAQLGFGIRPEEEAEILRAFGINPEQAFAGYQNMASELPRTQRLALIEAEIQRNAASFPQPADMFKEETFGTLFRAVQLQDVEAIQKIQGLIARETARWQGSGGVRTDQQGASAGLRGRGAQT
jgi:hypothetical protein